MTEALLRSTLSRVERQVEKQLDDGGIVDDYDSQMLIIYALLSQAWQLRRLDARLAEALTALQEVKRARLTLAVIDQPVK
jgi:hypothetical protein